MGQLTLPASGSVYIDADAVIYSVEKIEPYWTLLQPMWWAAKAGQFAIIGSELLLLETLVKPFQTGDTTLEKSFRDLLMNAAEVRLVPMSITVLESAARLRAQLGLRTPDAIHAATALAAGCALFATNDKGFRRAPVSERAKAYPATGLSSSLRHSSYGRLPSRQRGDMSQGLLPTEALTSEALWLCSSETLTADPLR